MRFRHRRRRQQSAARQRSRYGLERLEARRCLSGTPLVTVASLLEVSEASESFDIVLRLSEPTDVPVVIDFKAVDGTASFGSDYGLFRAGALGTTGSLRFHPGQQTVGLTVKVWDDGLIETSETFRIDFSNAKNAALAVDSCVVTITEAAASRVVLTGPQGYVREGEDVVLQLSLGTPSNVDQVFLVAANGITASRGFDFSADGLEQVTIPAGEASASFTIHILEDSVPERLEKLRVSARPLDPRLQPPRDVIVTILDVAATPARPVRLPELSITDATVREGNSGVTKTALEVGLSAATNRPVTVVYTTVDATATTADGDYRRGSGMLVFRPGELAKTIEFDVFGDERFEPDESFLVVLRHAVNARLPEDHGVIWILNDDPEPEPEPPFSITVRFVESPLGTVPAGVQEVTRQAAERWSSIITADLPDVAADGILIDDMDIVVQWGLLGGAPNGPSGILANAGPTGFRDNGQGLPFRGVSGINPFYADTSTEAQRLALLDTMTHEFGHVMGFSPGANVFGRWIVGNTFTGPNAVREYNELFGVTVNSVPLQANVRAHSPSAPN